MLSKVEVDLISREPFACCTKAGIVSLRCYLCCHSVTHDFCTIVILRWLNKLQVLA